MTEKDKKTDMVDFQVDGDTYQTQLTENYKNRQSWEAPNDKEIKAHIPGTIVSVEVNSGDAVKQGTLLLVLEAMKMQNRIEMPFDGVIKVVNVTAGQVVPKNFVMIEIE